MCTADGLKEGSEGCKQIVSGLPTAVNQPTSSEAQGPACLARIPVQRRGVPSGPRTSAELRSQDSG